MTFIPSTVHIIGGGLAGSEAAGQLLKEGLAVVLHEMRPIKQTPAHKSSNLAELVCSNSFKSLDPLSASGCLKNEMNAFDSLIMKSAMKAKVPAGSALAVDRAVFSEAILSTLSSYPNFELRRGEVITIPGPSELAQTSEYWIVSTGPLTSEGMFNELKRWCGDSFLYFYDAIAPILSVDSIDMEECFRADRYEKGEGDGDYLNVALTKVEYETFVSDLIHAEKAPLHDFEKAKYFESCLPIEVLAERGLDTLRFGPMKPVGLVDPKTGRMPYAVIQLRFENVYGTMVSMVGFQTKMKWGEQTRVFSKLKAFANLEFFRYGSVHRNTYINSPRVLNSNLSLRSHPRVFLAGQITGVEGYLESSAMGLMAAQAVIAEVKGQKFVAPPKETVLGSLVNFVTQGGKGDYSPMNANFGLLPPVVCKSRNKQDKKSAYALASQRGMEGYMG